MTRIVPLLILSTLTACFDEVSCTLEARSSVDVTVVDAAGLPMPDAVVSFSTDGGATFEPCEEMSDGGFVCGWEVEGEIIVTSEVPFYATASETVTVEADECHVIGEQVELVMVGPDCTASVEASTLVTVTTTDGGAPVDLAVTYEDLDDPHDSTTPCEEQAGGAWVCGWEEPGNLRITAAASGYATATADVTVDADVCHVITESVALELSAVSE